MAEHGKEFSAHTLMREMGLAGAGIERRQRIAGLGPEDLKRVVPLRDIIVEHVDELGAAFFDHLAQLPEGKALLASQTLADRARRLKREHLVAMVQGSYGPSYFEQRIELGMLYSSVGLDATVFLGAFNSLLKAMGATVMKQRGASMEAFESFQSLQKVAFLDIGLIVDVLVFERERTIRQQQEAIRELSTPTLQIRDRLLLLPIIGVIDTLRARLLTENLLRAIRANRAKVVVMDITGVATIDSKVANHLLQTVAAARLMGAEVIVTGLSSDVALSLVALGIDLATINTAGDLQGGIEEAELLLGIETIRKDEQRSLTQQLQ